MWTPVGEGAGSALFGGQRAERSPSVRVRPRARTLGDVADCEVQASEDRGRSVTFKRGTQGARGWFARPWQDRYKYTNKFVTVLFVSARRQGLLRRRSPAFAGSKIETDAGARPLPWPSEVVAKKDAAFALNGTRCRFFWLSGC